MSVVATKWPLCVSCLLPSLVQISFCTPGDSGLTTKVDGLALGTVQPSSQKSLSLGWATNNSLSGSQSGRNALYHRPRGLRSEPTLQLHVKIYAFLTRNEGYFVSTTIWCLNWWSSLAPYIMNTLWLSPKEKTLVFVEKDNCDWLGNLFSIGLIAIFSANRSPKRLPSPASRWVSKVQIVARNHCG